MDTTGAGVEHGQRLHVEEVDLADPGPQEVITDVAFAGLNPVDMTGSEDKAKWIKQRGADHVVVADAQPPG